MATKIGTNALVKVGAATVADLANWSFTDTREAIKAPVFGETFNKVHGMGTRNVTGSISGYLNIADSNGQEIIKKAYQDGTAITDFYLYIDDSIYYTGSEVYITSCNVSAAVNEVLPIEFSFEVSESWTRSDE